MTMNAIEEILGLRVTNFHEMPMPKRRQYRATFRTIVLSASKQIAPLLDGPDGSRCSVTIIANDAPAVLCDKSQAQDVQSIVNSGAANAQPLGSLIPQNFPIGPIEFNTDMYVTCPLSGNSVNRIAVITTHEIKDLI